MKTRIFRTTDSEHRHRNGQRVTVTRAIRYADEQHDAEVLPMFEVQFPDGAKLEVWRDELRGAKQ